MSENQLNRQLAAGIRAAQQGNRERARELLEGILRVDRDNEQAWIWLASVVESQRERRLSLERVLKINPNNQPAQQALNTMVGVLGNSEERPAINYAAISAAARTPAPVPTGAGNRSPAERAGTASGGSNLLPFLFGGAIVLGLLLAGSIILPPLLQPEPTATAVAVIQATEDLGPTVDPSIPTSTATTQPSPTFDANSVGEIATNTPSGGPTFTPTATLPPTETPLPTATLPALDVYDFLIRGFQGTAGSSIYELDGTGSGLNNILPNVDDFDYNPETGVIVFNRRIFIEQPTLTPVPTRTPSDDDVAPSGTQQSPGGLVVQTTGSVPDLLQFQMFITNINSISTQTEITSSTLPSAFEPAISPDGNFVAFATDVDGDVELYLYDVETGLSEQITDNVVFEDTQPEWSPDGQLLVFSSDRISAGNNDLFTIDPFDADPESTVTQVTDIRGQNIHPQWSPNGDQIAFINVNGDETTIRLTSLNGRFLQSVTNNPDMIYTNPVWTPDGNYLIYSSRTTDTVVPQIRSYAPLTNTEETLIVPNFGALQIVIR